jgi:hypothetical protein
VIVYPFICSTWDLDLDLDLRHVHEKVSCRRKYIHRRAADSIPVSKDLS